VIAHTDRSAIQTEIRVRTCLLCHRKFAIVKYLYRLFTPRKEKGGANRAADTPRHLRVEF